MFVSSGIVYGHNTRHTVNGLFIPHCKSTYGSRCFAQIGSRLWNNHLMMFRQLQVLTPLIWFLKLSSQKGIVILLPTLPKTNYLRFCLSYIFLYLFWNTFCILAYSYDVIRIRKHYYSAFAE